MSKTNKIGFLIMIISLLSMLLVLMVLNSKSLYAFFHIPLLIGLFMYSYKKQNQTNLN